MNKTIRAHEAHNDDNAIETVINGRRNLGVIGMTYNSLSNNFWDIIKTNNLKVLKIPSNPGDVYIYFRPGAEKQAQELKDIAEKYDGYLAYWATENDTRRIGQLLNYHQKDIEDFINRNKKNDRHIQKICNFASNYNVCNKPEKTITILCHTSLGDPLDEHGIFYLKGNEYKMSTEVSTPYRLTNGPDTNNQECILCWISFNEVYGSRFAIKGNIYHDGEPRWPHFTEYFVCPIQRERDNKLNEIGI